MSRVGDSRHRFHAESFLCLIPPRLTLELMEFLKLDALDRQMDAWWDVSTVLLKGILYAEGYYQHDRGAWRKRPNHG